MEILNPAGWAKPRGYSNGIVADGPVVFVAGQVGWDAHGTLAGPGIVAQFDRALANVIDVVAAAGGTARSIVRLTIFVADVIEYSAARREIGEHYRARMGRHYPAMTLVQVAALLEPGARVEIEATAVLERG